MPRRPKTEFADLGLHIDAWVNHLDDTLSERTRDIYERALRNLQAFLATRQVVATSAIRREHIEAFYGYLRDDRGWAPATINQTHRALVQFVKYLVQEALLTASPVEHVKAPRIPETLHPTITADKQRRILANVKHPTSFAGRRSKAILALFFDGGLRRSEMAGLKLTDIDWANKRVCVTGKAGKQRLVPFGRQTKSLLSLYIAARTRWVNERRRRERYAESPWLWMGEQGPMTLYGIEDTVKKTAAKAGFPDITCHSYRRGWTHEQLMMGADPGAVASMAGWNSTQMVAHYAKATQVARALETYRSPMDRLLDRE